MYQEIYEYFYNKYVILSGDGVIVIINTTNIIIIAQISYTLSS